MTIFLNFMLRLDQFHVWAVNCTFYYSVLDIKSCASPKIATQKVSKGQILVDSVL